MKSFFWLVLGVAAGFIAAHLANRTPAGRALFADLDQRTREFTGGIVDGYRSREAELRDDADLVPDARTIEDPDGPIETATGTGAAAFSETAEPTGTAGSH